MTSYWTATSATRPLVPDIPLPGQCQVVVVGAGFTGLAAAYYLARDGVSVVVLDRETVAFGASGRNGGQLLHGWPADLVQLKRRFGLNRTEALWSVSDEAVARVRRLAEEEQIDCDLATPGHLEALLGDDWEQQVDAELALLSELGASGYSAWSSAVIEERTGVCGYRGGIHDDAAMAFHPRRYALGLAHAVLRRGGAVYEHTDVQAIETTAQGFLVKVRGGPVISTAAVVLATNGYPPRFAPALRARLLPVDSAQIAIELPKSDSLPMAMPTVSDWSVQYH